MNDIADRFLSGPRGRRACLEYARLTNEAVNSSLFWLAHELDANPGVLFRIGDGFGETTPDPQLTATDVAARIDAVELSATNLVSLREALYQALESAHYWQAPDGDDVVAALPEVRASLRPIAELIAQAMPDLASVRGKNQWAVDWNPANEAAPLFTDPAAALATWTREVAEDEARWAQVQDSSPHSPTTGTWWSVPLSTLETRGTVEAALDLVEDSFGWAAATFIPVSGSGSMFEVASAEDWAKLCREYPVEVTASRRHDWFRVTGRDGRWVIPDWERVADDWDAVHLTALGYFSSATQLIEVDDRFASIIAGWAPDSTLWLRDVAREATAPRQEWRRPTEQDEWTRTDQG